MSGGDFGRAIDIVRDYLVVCTGAETWYLRMTLHHAIYQQAGSILVQFTVAGQA